NGESILARPPRPVERSIRWLNRRRSTIGAVAGAIGLSALVGGLVYVSRPERIVPEPPGAKDRPVASKAERIRGPLPDDLALVPHDTSIFATIRLAEIVEQEGVKRLLQRLARYEKAFPAVARWQ